MNETLLLLISNTLTGIASFFVSRRMSNAQSDNQVLRNLELSISLYREIIDDLKVQIESLNIKIQHLEAKIDQLHEENKELKYGKGL